MNYKERARQVAKQYRLSVINLNVKSLDLETLLADEFKAVAREARKKLRQDLKEKANKNSTD